MKQHVLACLAGLLFTLSPTLAQTNDFGDRAVELRGLAADELAKPEIPDDAIAQPSTLTFRPLYLVKRYYSCMPWLRTHVRSVFCSVPGFNQKDPQAVQVDTAGDNPDLQLVNEQNEARLELHPGTVATHPAYGLYCMRIVICVRWDQWQTGAYHRWFVRFNHRCPYICWWEHWWYYWRHPRYVYSVTLSGIQEVPPNTSQATGAGLLFLEPLYRTICYRVTYGGLTSPWTAAHIHGPAAPGVNAGVLFPLDNHPSGPQAGALDGNTAALSAAQIGQLQSGLFYVNIHTTNFPGGEIRGQMNPVAAPVWCPWRPSWIPLIRWGRGGPLWCLTVTHPYGYGWDRWYRPRPFCLYGLRYYFSPVGSVQNPTPLPYINRLSAQLSPAVPWAFYPFRPILRYWPYSPYCARWYWWRHTPFNLYRHIPPVVQYATFVSPDPLDPPATQPFPDDPVPLPGTTGISTLRALVSQQGDLTGDGVMSLSDLTAYRQEAGTSSQDTADTDGK